MENANNNGSYQIYNLPLEFRGITLNEQDIDLMLIAGSNNIYELQNALSKITNIKFSIEKTDVSEEEFINIRQEVYDLYLNTLTSRIDYIRNRKIELYRKIEYLKLSGILSKEEILLLDDIISTSKSNEELIKKILSSFSLEKFHEMSKILRDFTPIEKTGIKSTTLEASRNLIVQIENNYNSITIDEEAKYGKVVLADGTYDFSHLKKTLDFAKKYNKKVRLNTLLFYMDCPDDLYNLENTPENKKIVKEKLIKYVDAITKFIKENGYSNLVRSIDVFNELLNRFEMEDDKPYMYRGDIPQDPNNDNIKSGWLKHLNINDLCDVISVARKNLPDTDFMYNDDNLIDPKKYRETINLIGQIRMYENQNNIKLIDSIGTQMHIDNGVTKEQMKEMFINLSKFNLPIEITEFDMAMLSNVDGLSEERIETIRKYKMNDIYDCIIELEKQCNIRGFTIWSKTDKQNFRVSLANEERIKQGLTEIETLHGGYYSENMKPKNSIFQPFNYHTHTFRCGHAKKSDKEYLEAAKKMGIVQLGFSDHVPVTNLELQNKNHQMNITQVDEYISSIRNLQKENPNMKINVGFEAEFDPRKEQFLGELREKVDYMILGQHFIPTNSGEIKQENNPEYPLEYAKMVCSAMDSGIFDIVAHPDIFMKYSNSFSPENEEKKKKFFENAIVASYMICNKAKSLGIPLELNFGEINEGKETNEITVPSSLFWNIAAETGVLVLCGVDAHNPEHFIEMKKNKEKMGLIIDFNKLNLVDSNYNPVEARKSNKELQELFQKNQEKSITYESNLIMPIINKVIDKIPDEEFSSKIFYKYIKKELLNIFKLILKNTKTSLDSIKQLPDFKETAKEIVCVLLKQKDILLQAKETVKTSIKMGCESKEDFRNVILQITEIKYTKEETKRRLKIEQLKSFQLSQNISTKKL